MAEQPEESLYLVIYQFNREDPLEERLRDDVPTIQRILDRVSYGRFERVFYSQSGDTFAYVICTHHWARYVRQQLNAPGRRHAHVPAPFDDRDAEDLDALDLESSPMKVRDNLQIFELGYDHGGIRSDRLLSWIERTDPR